MKLRHGRPRIIGAGGAPLIRLEREAQLDRLRDLIDEHLDTAQILRLLEAGAPLALPTLELTLRAAS